MTASVIEDDCARRIALGIVSREIVIRDKRRSDRMGASTQKLGTPLELGGKTSQQVGRTDYPARLIACQSVAKAKPRSRKLDIVCELFKSFDLFLKASKRSRFRDV
jgi:hypothetical protein